MSYPSIGEGSSSSNKPRFEQYDDKSSKGKEKYPANQSYRYFSEDRPQAPLFTSSSTYGAISPTNNLPEDNINSDERRSQKTCTYITILITACGVLVLFLLLWFAPTVAERSIEEGVAFSFQRAAILNITEDNIITMHITGKIELQPGLFQLQQTANHVFGTIGIRQSELRVHYQQKTESKAESRLVLAASPSMGRIDLPALNLNSVSSVTGFDFITRFMIEDTDVLMEFCKDAVVAKTVMWRVKGPLSVTLGWFPWNSVVGLDKTIELEGKILSYTLKSILSTLCSVGMDGLKKTDMQSMTFPDQHHLGGIQVSGTVGIFNPSGVLSLSLGDMDFGIYLPATLPDQKDVLIAVVQAIDADLQGHRMNYFNITGRTLPIPNESSYAKELMETFLSNYIHGNTTQVHVRGNRYGPDDQPSKKHIGTAPKWLRKALESVVLGVPFPGAKETDLIQSLQLSHIKIDFSSTGSPLISGDAIALLKKPQEMQFHMDVTEIDPHVLLYLNLDSTAPFASVQANHPCPAHGEEGNGVDFPLGYMKVISKLTRAPFNVLPGGQRDFEKFLNRVFHEKKGKVYIRGTSDARIESAFGQLTVRDLKFTGEVETQGLEGMQNPSPQLTSMTILQGFPDALLVKTDLIIYSPSNVDINLGELNMILLYNGHLIGNTTIPELALAPGVSNELTVSAWLFGNNKHVIDFIGEYISNGKTILATVTRNLETKTLYLYSFRLGINMNSNVTLTISGQHPNASKSELLNGFFQHLSFDVQAPPFKEKALLADCQMNILSSTVIMSLRNPFQDISMSIQKINATASYEIYEIGKVIADFEDLGEGWKGPMLLPPPTCDELGKCKGIVVESEKIPVITKKLGYEAIKKALGGSIEVSVDSQVGVMIDQFELKNLLYRQSNITAKVRKGF